MKILFSHSRTSLFYSLKLLELKQEDKILIPDFNCVSVMLAIKKMSIKYDTYPINRDLSINVKKLNNKIKKNVKAILIVNYFGITNDFFPILNICKKKKIYLINDNAHVATGKIKKKNIINYGDLALESYHKIFNNIESLSVLSINNNKLKKRLINLKLPTKKINKDYKKWFFKIKNLIKYILFKKLNFKKKINKNYDDKFFNFLPSTYDVQTYQNYNFNHFKVYRKEIIKSIKFVIDKFNLKLLRNNLDDKSMIWYYPVILNKKTKKSFFLYLKERNIPFISWPKLPNELKNKKNILIKKQIICLPIDYNYYEIS